MDISNKKLKKTYLNINKNIKILKIIIKNIITLF